MAARYLTNSYVDKKTRVNKKVGKQINSYAAFYVALPLLHRQNPALRVVFVATNFTYFCGCHRILYATAAPVCVLTRTFVCACCMRARCCQRCLIASRTPLIATKCLLRSFCLVLRPHFAVIAARLCTAVNIWWHAPALACCRMI